MKRSACFKIYPIILAMAVASAFVLAHAESEKMFTFIVQDRDVPGNTGRFRVRTSDPKVIQKARQELAKPENNRRLHISGRLASGNGQMNKPWHWHIVDNKWDLTQLNMEVRWFASNGREQNNSLG